jgi:hypothetical protein
MLLMQTENDAYTFLRRLTVSGDDDLLRHSVGIKFRAKCNLFFDCPSVFGLGSVQTSTEVLHNPTVVLIRKFPGLFGHPLTV